MTQGHRGWCIHRREVCVTGILDHTSAAPLRRHPPYPFQQQADPVLEARQKQYVNAGPQGLGEPPTELPPTPFEDGEGRADRGEIPLVEVAEWGQPGFFARILLIVVPA